MHRGLKKAVVFVAMTILIVFCGNICASACTAFCVKSENVYYGKNWDFDLESKNNVVFTLSEPEKDVFSLNFILKDSGFLCSAINSKGFFVTCNYDWGAASSAYKPGLEIGNIREAGVHFTKISDINEYIAGRNVVCNGYPEHVFFADKSGNGCVLETENTESYQINAQNNFLVATNFPLYLLRSLDDLGDAPCDRYTTAYTMINKNIEKFDLSVGMNVLKSTAQSAPQATTIYSFLYDAGENAVYLVLDQDFEKIWRFTFESKTIETYQGFEHDKEFAVNEQGVSLMDLLAYQQGDSGTIPFTDVSASDWFYDGVTYVCVNGLMNGTSSSGFEPNAELSQTMLATVLYRIEGEPQEANFPGFSDIPSDQWYSAAVNWAGSNGIVTGYGDGTFGADDALTREQCAAMLYRYAGYKGYDISAASGLADYIDAGAISDRALPAMRWAVAESLITGTTPTTLEPSSTVTRAQCAAIMMRFIENVV